MRVGQEQPIKMGKDTARASVKTKTTAASMRMDGPKGFSSVKSNFINKSEMLPSRKDKRGLYQTNFTMD